MRRDDDSGDQVDSMARKRNRGRQVAGFRDTTLNVKFSFEERPYKLGETINLTVELSAKRDMEGRPCIWCHEANVPARLVLWYHT